MELEDYFQHPSAELESRLYEALDRVLQLHPEDLDVLVFATGIDYDRKNHGD